MSDELKAGGENNNSDPKNTLNQPSGDLPSTPNVEPAKTNTSQPHKAEKYSVEWWKIRLEIIGIIAAVIMTVLMFGQWREMVNTTKEMHRASVTDERAWVAAHGITFGPSGGEDGMMYFTVHYKNTGKTPALNTQAVIKSNANINAAIPSDVMPSPRTGGGLVAPDGEEFIRIKAPTEAVRFVHTIYIYGTIWYDDIFGKHHWSQFCYTVEVDAKFNIVAGSNGIHNGCDSN